jgi:hypothetical protein
MVAVTFVVWPSGRGAARRLWVGVEVELGSFHFYVIEDLEKLFFYGGEGLYPRPMFFMGGGDGFAAEGIVIAIVDFDGAKGVEGLIDGVPSSVVLVEERLARSAVKMDAGELGHGGVPKVREGTKKCRFW